MDNRTLRLRCFRTYSKDLETYLPRLAGRYACPICLEDFDEKAAEAGQLLTAEDVPPKAVGGRVRTMTCRACNEGSGKEFDSQALRRLELDEFLAGLRTPAAERKHPVIANAVVDDRRVPGQVLIRRYVEGVRRAFKAFRPEDQNAIDVALARGSEIKVSGHYPVDTRRAHLSYARAGYLLMFVHFGYAYACSPAARRLCEQFQRPNESIFKPEFIESGEGFGPRDGAIGLVPGASAFRCFVALLAVRAPIAPRHLAVVLPGPDDHELAVYERWRKHRPALGAEVSLKIIDSTEFLAPAMPLSVQRIWAVSGGED